MEEHKNEREIKEKLKRMTFDERDLERHTLKHKHDKDMHHFREMDEGY